MEILLMNLKQLTKIRADFELRKIDTKELEKVYLSYNREIKNINLFIRKAK